MRAEVRVRTDVLGWRLSLYEGGQERTIGWAEPLLCCYMFFLKDHTAKRRHRKGQDREVRRSPSGANMLPPLHSPHFSPFYSPIR